MPVHPLPPLVQCTVNAVSRPPSFATTPMLTRHREHQSCPGIDYSKAQRSPPSAEAETMIDVENLGMIQIHANWPAPDRVAADCK